jgi:hypothetical protein
LSILDGYSFQKSNGKRAPFQLAEKRGPLLREAITPSGECQKKPRQYGRLKTVLDS